MAGLFSSLPLENALRPAYGDFAVALQPYDPTTRPTYPPLADKLLRVAGTVLGLAVVYAVLFGYFLLAPSTTDAGYMPTQPIPYSHAIHVGKLGLDCRYCHTTVDKAGFAAIPPAQTCMNCHTNIQIKDDKGNPSAKLELLRQAYGLPPSPGRDRMVEPGDPIRWKKVNNLPNYVYFNHSAHVNRGVGCSECHGRIDKMDVVWQENALSMTWCLECHRNPEPRIRPRELVTQMDYRWKTPPEEQLKNAQETIARYHIKPSQDCSTCHR